MLKCLPGARVSGVVEEAAGAEAAGAEAAGEEVGDTAATVMDVESCTR